MTTTRVPDVGPTAGPAEIVPGIWRVGGGSWGGVTSRLSSERDGNVYLLALDGATVLVDTGTHEGQSAVEANILATGVDAAAVTDILLTHSHWDHTEMTARWQRRSFANTHLSAVGERFLTRDDHRLVGYQLHGPGYPFEPFRVDHAVNDGERFALGRSVLTAQSLPGHTPDSTLYTFQHRGEEIAIGGDIVFGSRTPTTFVLGHLCSLWLSNLEDYVSSLKRLSDVQIDCLLPGHGDVLRGRARVREAIRETLAVAESLANASVVRSNFGV